MIRSALFDPAAGALHEGGVELLEVWQKSPDALLWMMIEGEEPQAERELLEKRFGFHPLAVNDAVRNRHPAKLEEFSNETFVLVKGLAPSREVSLEFRTIQIAMFVGERLLVTRSSAQSLSSERLFEEVTSGEIAPDLPRSQLALLLSRRIFDRFLPILMRVERRLEEMEDELLASPTDDLLTELVRQKGDLKHMLRIVQGHAGVFGELEESPTAHFQDVDHYLKDVREHLERHLSMSRLYFELSSDLMDGYLSLSAHRLNQVMQTLTIVTVIFVPVTFLAGLYGMNFEYMPELRVRGAYFVALGVMATMIFGILVFFRRKGWLGAVRPPKSSRDR